jgi:hypothetical protein
VLSASTSRLPGSQCVVRKTPYVIERAGSLRPDGSHDEVIKRMGFEPQGAGGPGALFHWVTKTSDGIRVTDVWETQEDFDKFAEEKIGPITQAVGIQSQPEIQYFDVHNYLTAG